MKQCNEVFQNFYLRRTKKVTPIAKPQAIMAKRKQEIENQKVINFLCSENGNVQKDKILILCEGYTEVKYFSSLVEKSDGLEKIKIKKGKDVDPLSLVGEAKRYLSFDRTHEKKLSEVWIVFDRDNHYSYQSALERPQEILKSKSRGRILVLNFGSCCTLEENLMTSLGQNQSGIRQPTNLNTSTTVRRASQS